MGCQSIIFVEPDAVKEKERINDMKRILVTGCNGQLGRAINKEYAQEDIAFINTDVAEGEGVISLDITDVNAVLSCVEETKPDVIINCAAHTNVDACESQWDLAYKINAIGARNLSIAAEKTNAKLIHVSTDYVFPGTSPQPLTEFDTPDPIRPVFYPADGMAVRRRKEFCKNHVKAGRNARYRFCGFRSVRLSDKRSGTGKNDTFSGADGKLRHVPCDL